MTALGEVGVESDGRETSPPAHETPLCSELAVAGSPLEPRAASSAQDLGVAHAGRFGVVDAATRGVVAGDAGVDMLRLLTDVDRSGGSLNSPGEEGCVDEVDTDAAGV